MKKILTVVLLLSFVCEIEAQTKPKSATQSTKPSKVFTIKYLNEKLNENCIGYCNKKTTYSYAYKSEYGKMIETDYYFSQSYYKNYTVEEENGTAYIEIQIQTETSHLDHETHENTKSIANATLIIPVNKITSIEFVNIPTIKLVKEHLLL